MLKVFLENLSYLFFKKFRYAAYNRINVIIDNKS